MHLAIGDYPKAIEEFYQAAWSDGDNPTYYYNLGRAYYQSGAFGDAITPFTYAVNSQPSNANYYYSRGLAYKASGDLANGITDLEKALELRQFLDTDHSAVEELLRAWKDELLLRSIKGWSWSAIKHLAGFAWAGFTANATALLIITVTWLVGRTSFVSTKAGVVGILCGGLTFAGAYATLHTLLKRSRLGAQVAGALLSGALAFLATLLVVNAVGWADSSRQTDILHLFLCGLFGCLLVGAWAVIDVKEKSANEINPNEAP